MYLFEVVRFQTDPEDEEALDPVDERTAFARDHQMFESGISRLVVAEARPSVYLSPGGDE